MAATRLIAGEPDFVLPAGRTGSAVPSSLDCRTPDRTGRQPSAFDDAMAGQEQTGRPEQKLISLSGNMSEKSALCALFRFCFRCCINMENRIGYTVGYLCKAAFQFHDPSIPTSIFQQKRHYRIFKAHTDDAAISPYQGGTSRHAALVPDGRFL